MFGALQLGLGLTRGQGSGLPWYPNRLFQSGDILCWYDPSDLTTLFQDTAGTIPVTADGQSVALQLDKGQWGGKTLEQVLAAQTELAPSDGSTLTGWTTSDSGGGSTTSDGTSIRIQFDGSGSGFAGIATAPGLGKTYRVEATIVVASGILTLQIGSAVRNFTSGTYTLSRTIGQTPAVNIVEFKRFNVSTAVDATVSAISIKEIPGYHRTQATGTSMPKYKTDGTLHWLRYDGTDDGHATGTITWGTDEVAICAGVTKSSDAASAIFAELSANAGSNNGTFYVAAPATAGQTRYNFLSRGTASAISLVNSSASPTTDVVTCTGDISGDNSVMRLNGVEGPAVTTDQGTGNYGSHVLYFGRRGGSSLPFNGREYQTVIRNRLLSAAELSKLETFVAEKTGVIL